MTDHDGWPEPWTRRGLFSAGLRTVPIALVGGLGTGAWLAWTSIALALVPAFLLQRRAAHGGWALALRLELLAWSGLAAWVGFLGGALNGVYLGERAAKGHAQGLEAAQAAWRGLSEPADAGGAWHALLPHLDLWPAHAHGQVPLLAALVVTVLLLAQAGLQAIEARLRESGRRGMALALALLEVWPLAAAGALLGRTLTPETRAGVGIADTPWVQVAGACALLGLAVWVGGLLARVVGGARLLPPAPGRSWARYAGGAAALGAGLLATWAVFVLLPRWIAPPLLQRWMAELEHGSAQERVAAARQLGAHRDQLRVLTLLVQTMDDSNPAVAWAAADPVRGLGRVTLSARGFPDAFTRALELASRDSQPLTRQGVVRDLFPEGSAPELELLLRLCLDPAAQVQSDAVDRLALLGDTPDATSLWRALDDPLHRGWRDPIVKGLRAQHRGLGPLLEMIGARARAHLAGPPPSDPLALPDLVALLVNGGRAHSARATEELRGLLRAAPRRKRVPILHAIRDLGWPARDAVPDLVQVTADGSFDERVAATEALAEMAGPGPVNDALEELARDSEPEVRDLARRALERSNRPR